MSAADSEAFVSSIRPKRPQTTLTLPAIQSSIAFLMSQTLSQPAAPEAARLMPRPTPYKELNSVLEELVAGVKAAVGEAFVGAYLQGSFAVGDFDRHSDVDFIIVVSDELGDDHVDALQAMHRRIYGLPSEWAQHLDGSYFPAAILRNFAERAKPLWYLDHGSESLIRSDHCNTLVVRSVVREHGVILAGPGPATLLDAVPVDALRQEIRAVIRDWGHQI